MEAISIMATSVSWKIQFVVGELIRLLPILTHPKNAITPMASRTNPPTTPLQNPFPESITQRPRSLPLLQYLRTSSLPAHPSATIIVLAPTASLRPSLRLLRVERETIGKLHHVRICFSTPDHGASSYSP